MSPICVISWMATTAPPRERSSKVIGWDGMAYPRERRTAHRAVAMIRIWGRPNSICTQRVLWACTEADVEFELTLASGTMGANGHVSTGAEPYGVVDTPSYRGMNPNGTVPTIEDGGFVLWESNAIVAYLGLKYGLGTLLDGSPVTLGRAVQWMTWTNGHLEPHLHTLVMQLRRLRADLRTSGAVEAAVRGITPALEILDAHLARDAYVAGGRFSMGDIPAGAAAHRWRMFTQPGPVTPNLDAWLERLGEREGFRRHVASAELHV